MTTVCALKLFIEVNRFLGNNSPLNSSPWWIVYGLLLSAILFLFFLCCWKEPRRQLTRNDDFRAVPEVEPAPPHGRAVVERGVASRRVFDLQKDGVSGRVEIQLQPRPAAQDELREELAGLVALPAHGHTQERRLAGALAKP